MKNNLLLNEKKTKCKENMEKNLNIYQRINLVMKEVTYVQKGDKKLNGQYSFVTHDAVSSALHEPMARHGIVMVPSVAELIQDGNRTSLKMYISFVNVDNPSDCVTITQYGYGIDTQDKGIGKAQSYAVKYALLKMFCLETGDDPEKDNIEYQPAKPAVDPAVERKILEERKREILSMIGEDDIQIMKEYIETVKKTYKSKREEDIFLTVSSQEFVKKFSAWKEKQARVA